MTCPNRVALHGMTHSLIELDKAMVHVIRLVSFLWKKSYDQPRQHIKKQRHYFATKIHLAKAMFFPVVIYGCESWTIKKTEHQRIDAFEL